MRATNCFANLLVMSAILLAYPAVAVAAVGSGSKYGVVISTGDTTADGETLASDISSLSVNKFGSLAFIANVRAGSTTGSAVMYSNKAATPQRLSFTPSTIRIFSSTQIADSGDIVAQDRVSGAPPQFLVRLWRVNSGNIIASTTDRVFDAVLAPAIANDGGVTFVALSNALSTTLPTVTALYNNRFSIRGDNNFVTELSGGGFRPVIGDGQKIVVRTGGTSSAPIKLFNPSTLLPSLFSSHTVSSFLVNGQQPGITGDGSIVAFAAQRDASSSMGVWLYNTLTKTRSSEPVVIAGTEYVSTPQTAQRLSVLSGDSKVAVEKIDSFFGNQYRIMFIGTDSATNTAALFSARVEATASEPGGTQRVFGLTPIATVGRTLPIDGLSETSRLSAISISDPLTTVGRTAFVASFADGSQSVVTFNASSVTKWKQGDSDGNPLSTWGASYLHPMNASSNTFEKKGCFLTSLATISSFYGHERTPIEQRDDLLRRGILNLDGTLALGDHGTVLVQVGSQAVRIASRGGTYDDIVSHLRNGEAVMLGVPSSKQTELGNSDGNLHAMVAYGINPQIGASAAVTPSDIYVSDPGRYDFYRDRYNAQPGRRYTPGEELINVTLEDAFDRFNSSSTYEFRAEDWFNHGTFTNAAGETITLSAFRQRQDMTFFELASGDQLVQFPRINVNSPLDLIVFDPVSGVRFVTDASLATGSDVLLSKIYFEEAGGEPEGPDQPDVISSEFPPYSLLLPSSLVGRSLSVELVGTGNGEYSVELFSGTRDLASSAALTGHIVLGERVSGLFTVTPVPEPGTNAMITVGMIALSLIGARRSRQRQSVCQRE